MANLRFEVVAEPSRFKIMNKLFKFFGGQQPVFGIFSHITQKIAIFFRRYLLILCLICYIVVIGLLVKYGNL